MIRALLLALLCAAWPLSAAAAADSVDLDISAAFARQGSRVLALVEFTIPEGYHAYAHRPGGSGKPTNLDFVVEGDGAAPVLYPRGIEEPDIYDPGTKAFTYSGQTRLLALLPEGIGGRMYAATLDMLLCSARHCLPFTKTISGSAPGQIRALAAAPWREAAEELLKQESDGSGAVSIEEGKAPPPVEQSGAAPVQRRNPPLAMPESAAPEQARGAFDLELEPRYVSAEAEIYSLGKALLFGLLAGMLLNAMPCVLPVLTLKISSLLLMGGSKAKLREFRAHNVCFALGVMTLFTILALALGLADMMWGQLYQNQWLILIMMLIVFLMGLSMLGVFVLPAIDLRIGDGARNPMLKSYFTGLVSTFLATPCSGPLLGGVLAWAFTQPLQILMMVFWSVGAGMAMPYIAFSIWPGLARVLPRPGDWMLVFERVLGFLLLATTLYLIYVLPDERRMAALWLLLLAAFCAWLWGAFCSLSAPAWRRRLGAAIGALLLAGGIAWIMRPPSPEPKWLQFSPERFAKDIGHREMLVEFTASWCPNCKFLEATVLTDKNLSAWQKRYGMALIKVDLTSRNPHAEDLLSQLGSKSIPLTALFPAGADARKPLVLRDLYSQASLESAMKKTF